MSPTPTYGQRKNVRRDVGASLAGMPRTCGKLFLDSGAHSLFNEHVLGKPDSIKFDWYMKNKCPTNLSKAFKRYLDGYGDFVNQYREGIDHYVTVDAIYNPEISWGSFIYLRRIHSLNPIPVIHHKTPLSWIKRYIDEGCKIIGIGGMGQDSTRQDYVRWADRVFQFLCPPPHYKPVVKVHGFAVTTYGLLLRYPWWSVDSSSWAKAAGYGTLLVPHRRNRQFDFSDNPYAIGMSAASPSASIKGRHYSTLSEREQHVVQDWLNKIGIPLGTVDAKGKTVYYGVLSEYNARAVANLKFFTEMAKWLGNYPKRFKAQVKSRFDDDDIPVLAMKPVKDINRPMHIAFSGGSPIPECNLDRPTIMLSAFINAKNWRPDARFRKLMEIRSK